MVHERHEFSRKIKRAALDRANGHCEVCGCALRPGRYRFDHRVPDWIGGDNSLDNCVVQCVTCDAPKTANDQSVIAKIKRIQDKHSGVYRSRSPMPFGRRSKLKRKVTGEVVLR